MTITDATTFEGHGNCFQVGGLYGGSSPDP